MKAQDQIEEETKVSVETLTVLREGRMPSLRPCCFLVFLWSLSFIVILAILIKVDFLRNRILVDEWTNSQEYTKLEAKAQWILSMQEKRLKKLKTSSNRSDESVFNKVMRILNETMSAKSDFGHNHNVAKDLRKCVAQNNIVFIKTHKTGSSTITNILNRYADLRELSVAIPAMGDVRFAWPRRFHWSSVDLLRLDGEPANILSNHARYNREQMDKIMADGSQYITILRDPIFQFESSFHYFEFNKMLGMWNKTNPIETFLTAPDNYLMNLTELRGDLPETMNLVQNGMFYDLGYDFLDLSEEDAVRRVIEKLERDLKLVLIMEHFDESLVLLMHEMCWDFDDILYIKQNERSNKHSLSETTKDQIRKWNRADSMLYEHFNKTLWKKISKYGSQFWKDLSEFKRKNNQLKRNCSPEKITIKGYKINVDISSFVMNPKVNPYHRYLCKKTLKTEVEYLRYFRRKLGLNFGYQKILMAEGLRNITRSNSLNKRLKRLHRSPKFLFKKQYLQPQPTRIHR